ncbi:MAG: PilN domain-containing protein [Ectothiorhodospiraceae bacterium]
MRQEINLYQPLRRRRDWLAPGLLPVWLMVVVTGLAGVSLAQWWQNQRLEERADALAASVEGEEQELEELRAELPPQEPDPELEAELAGLEAEISARRRLKDEVLAGSGPWRDGFSPLFRALARAPLESVWLQAIRAGADGRLQLEGRALEAEAVPAFMDQLGEEPELIGQSFAGVAIQRPEEGSGPLRFVLQRSQADDDAEQ